MRDRSVSNRVTLPVWARVLLIIACLLPASQGLLAQAAADAVNPLPNAGFEEGEAGWEIRDAISFAIPEAARTGKLGLRVGSLQPTQQGSQVLSARFAVTPGQEVTVSFWARSESSCAGVYLLFRDAQGKWLKDPAKKAGGGLAMAGIRKTGQEWIEYTLTGAAPENAATASIWAHSYGSTAGVADIDDLAIAGLPASVAVIPAAAVKRPEPEKTIDPAAVPARKAPPVIILKLDDLKQHNGKPHPRWDRVADYLDSRGIKGSIGVICQTLEDATPQYADWINKRRDSGQWEFWFHGWDHAVHEVDGVKYNEFKQRSFDEQKKRFDDSQRLALEKLGFTFETFGPPGGVGNGTFDDNTAAVMAADPYIKVWLYPAPLNEAGKALEAQGKVVILDRVWAVNLEGSVGSPDFNRFLEGYAKHLDRPYFVLQGHPTQWNDVRFEEFTRIIGFLIEQQATFMTPTEYATIKKSE